VVADLKLDSGHVPILPHVTVAVIAKECLLSPSHATQTVVQLMVAGARGTIGVSVLRQSVAYKQEQENVVSQSQHMVERNAVEPEQS